jgi:hypothetical protein
VPRHAPGRLRLLCQLPIQAGLRALLLLLAELLPLPPPLLPALLLAGHPWPPARPAVQLPGQTSAAAALPLLLLLQQLLLPVLLLARICRRGHYRCCHRHTQLQLDSNPPDTVRRAAVRSV